MPAIEHQTAGPQDRAELRRTLKARRKDWLARTPEAVDSLERRLRELLRQLEPLCLGLYWPLEGEFNAPGAWLRDPLPDVGLALPYAFKADRRMQYRRWDGAKPALQDEMGIPSCAGAPADPDVVLVPCLGYTRRGFRLGYGGGYFDRWLAAHPGVTTVGVAWSVGECTFEPADHDLPLTLILTERELRVS